jgi:hypothetical protein
MAYKSPKRQSPKKKSPAKAPGTPKVKSSSLNVGDKRKGRDGHFYRVEQRKTGHYWRKCGKGKGGANCSPLIPENIYN